MRSRLIYVILALSVAINGALLWSVADRPSDAWADPVNGEELSTYMGQMQRLAHKLGLSIDAKNQKLAEFYVKEIGETAQVIQTKFPEYDGVQVAALSKAMLDPYMAPLDKAVKAGDWAAAGTGYTNLLNSGCNGCHTATQHPFLVITAVKTNPYNQKFTP